MTDSHSLVFEIVDLSNPPTEPIANALGIEMTDPEIAGLCGLGNIDPQHGPSSTPTSPAAIEACLDEPVPPSGTRLLTVRPDVDSVGGMAVFLLRSRGFEPGVAREMRERIIRVAESDRFARGPWPGPRELHVTIDEILADGDGPDLTAMKLCVSDRNPEISLARKVEDMANWLQSGRVPEIYHNQAYRSASPLLKSIANKKTVFATHHDGAIASVISNSSIALRHAYRLAPVVAALNPNFRFASGERGRKFTIARWDETHADLDIVAKHLAQLEEGWGGQPGIKGSPQRHPSRLDLEQVIECLSYGLPNAPVQDIPVSDIPVSDIPVSDILTPDA